MPVGRLPINLSGLVVEKRAIRREAVTLRLPMPPSTNNLFMNVKAGRIPTKNYVDWRAAAANYVSQAKYPRISGPVEIAMTFQEQTRLRDLDNCAKAPLDLLVALRVIDGDDAKVLRKLTLDWGDVEGVIIQIFPASGEWKTRRNMGKVA